MGEAMEKALHLNILRCYSLINLAHAPMLTGYAPVHVTLGFQLSASRIGSILSLTILHSVLTTDYTVANNFESNDYYTIN
jgi:hypothetical protein